MDEKLLNIIKKHEEIIVVDSFEKAKMDKHRKVVVFTGTDIYFTYKHHGNVFGELVCWVEDEFEDKTTYIVVDKYLDEFSNTTNEVFDKRIDEDSILENFIPYEE